jgi:phosphate transport system permease protein
MTPVLRRRRWFSTVALGISMLATALGLAVLAWILGTLIFEGFKGWSWTTFTEMTPAPLSEGGLLNAIFGSFVMTGIGIGLGAPIGMLAGTYLAEYGRRSKLTPVIRFINDVLLSAPSIVVGLFVYEIVVTRMGTYSAIAGALALSIIALPVIVRTTEDMLRLVPVSLREGSAALGAQPWRTITSVIYPAARSGLVTSVLLAVARISGETAPLLFTALNNQFWNSDLTRPMANLPTVIYNYAGSPYENWQVLAWAGALMITLFVLVLSILARSTAALFGGGQRGGH